MLQRTCQLTLQLASNLTGTFFFLGFAFKYLDMVVFSELPLRQKLHLHDVRSVLDNNWSERGLLRNAVTFVGNVYYEYALLRLSRISSHVT